jgi:hypothetical protein
MSICFYVSRGKPRIELNFHDSSQVRYSLRKRNFFVFLLYGGTTKMSRGDAQQCLFTYREDRTRYVHDEKRPAFQKEDEDTLSRTTALVCGHEDSSPFAASTATLKNKLTVRQQYDRRTIAERLYNNRRTIAERPYNNRRTIAERLYNNRRTTAERLYNNRRTIAERPQNYCITTV